MSSAFKKKYFGRSVRFSSEHLVESEFEGETSRTSSNRKLNSSKGSGISNCGISQTSISPKVRNRWDRSQSVVDVNFRLNWNSYLNIKNSKVKETAEDDPNKFIKYGDVFGDNMCTNRYRGYL